MPAVAPTPPETATPPQDPRLPPAGYPVGLPTRSPNLQDPIAMRFPATAALLTALTLCLGCSSNKQKELTKEELLGVYIENALRYFEMRELERCEHQCLQALNIDPENERFLLLLGNVYLRRGMTEDILKALKVFELHPNKGDYRIHLGLGEAHERLAILEEEASEAIASGDRYTERDPEERAAELALSSVEHLTIANAAFLEAEQIHQGELNAVNGLIRTHALLGEDEKSINWSEVLIDVLLTSSKLRRVELEDVGKELMRAIRSNTGMVIKTHFHVASLYGRMGRTQEAADELGKIISLDPQVSEAYSRRAQLFFKLGQHLKAKESVEKFINLEAARPFEDPDIRAAYDLMARCDAALSGNVSSGG